MKYEKRRCDSRVRSVSPVGKDKSSLYRYSDDMLNYAVKIRLSCALAATLGLLASAASAQTIIDASLPDGEEFLARVRGNLIEQYDEQMLLSGYVYQVRSLRSELDGDRQVKDSETSVADIYHFSNGPFRVTRLRDGEALSTEEMREQTEALERHARGEGDRGWWPPWRRERSEDEHQDVVDDIFDAYDFTLLRRELVEDRPAIVVGFAPAENAPHSTYAGKVLLPKVRGTAWIDEQDHKVARIRVEVFAPVTIGRWGMLARIGSGSYYVKEWRKINGEVWLPTSFEIQAQTRAFLLKGTHTNVLEEYSDYRKFASDTTFEFVGEVPEL